MIFVRTKKKTRWQPASVVATAVSTDVLMVGTQEGDVAIAAITTAATTELPMPPQAPAALQCDCESTLCPLSSDYNSDDLAAVTAALLTL